MMYANSKFVRGTWRVFAGFLWLIASAASAQLSVPPPQITLPAQGGFTVSYPPCLACVGHGLEGYSDATGNWDYVGAQSLAINNPSEGIYRYRTVYLMMDSAGQYYASYSTEATVTVGSNATAAVPPSLTEQLRVEYRSLRGDLDSDGIPELLVRSGSDNAIAESGVNSYVLLRQSGNGSMSASRPDASELAATNAWQIADLEIVARDVNIDGQADLVLRGVSAVTGFEQTANQIVFGVGGGSGNDMLEVRAIDPALARFSRDINRHLLDPEFYPNNAPLTYAVIFYVTPYCDSWTNSWTTEASFFLPCFAYVNYYYVVYRDYSVYDSEAMHIASDDYGMIHGIYSPSNAMQHIDIILERVLGVAVGGWDISDLLGEVLDDESTRRGIELFSVIAGISEAAAQEPGTMAPQSDDDRVLLKGRRVLGRGPFHTALEYQGSTVSAFDTDPRLFNDGLLLSEVNWPNDHPTLTLRHGYVDGPSIPPLYWASLLAADSRYDDGLPYDLFPSLGQGGYNSNSFVNGLIQVTLGTPTVSMEDYVGGERPVPAVEFR